MPVHSHGSLTASFRILGETEELLAVSKPSGVLIHPTRPDGTRTLWHELRALLAYECRTGGQVSLINRLDRETSGVVLIAKTREAARECAMAMAKGRIQKRYTAWVYGWPEWKQTEVDAPILRAGEVCENRVWLRRMVHPKGAPAKTQFRKIHTWAHPTIGKLSEIEAIPLTGRTHQIRVHLAHLGYPVVGDKLYVGDGRLYLEFIETGWTPALEAELHVDRHVLHSAYLAVEVRGQKYIWEAPLSEEKGGRRLWDLLAR